MSTIRIVLSICNSCVTCSIGPAGYAVIMILFMMVPWEFTVVTWPRTQQNKLATVPLLLIYNMVGLEVIPQKKKKKSLSNLFLTFLKFSHLMSLWKKKKKYIQVTLLVQDFKTIIPLYVVHGLKYKTMFSECTHARSPDYLIFMHNIGCAVQNWGITLKLSL